MRHMAGSLLKGEGPPVASVRSVLPQLLDADLDRRGHSTLFCGSSGLGPIGPR